jgi:hypothetical protein
MKHTYTEIYNLLKSDIISTELQINESKTFIATPRKLFFSYAAKPQTHIKEICFNLQCYFCFILWLLCQPTFQENSLLSFAIMLNNLEERVKWTSTQVINTFIIEFDDMLAVNPTWMEMISFKNDFECFLFNKQFQ